MLSLLLHSATATKVLALRGSSRGHKRSVEKDSPVWEQKSYQDVTVVIAGYVTNK